MRLPTRREAVLLRRALPTVLSMRAGLRLRGLERIRRRMASRRANEPATPAAMREVAWSVRVVSRLVPGATCLTQALAGQALLARRGMRARIEITLPMEGPAPQPHAWLLCEDVVVLGGAAAERRAHRALITLDVDGRTVPAPPSPRSAA